MTEPFAAVVRIKHGTAIFQDHQFMRWPKDQDMLFRGYWNGKFWDCVADGYGNINHNGDYGAGSIFVRAYDGVEIVERLMEEVRG